MNLTAAASTSFSLIGGPFERHSSPIILKSAAAPLLGSRLLAANDRISLAFIGIGVMGSENLQRGYGSSRRRCQRRVRRVSAESRTRCRVARRGGQQPERDPDFREILADKSIDAVCISTPDHWHPYMTVEACKAGKDVYVEKPACVAIDEGAVMVQAAASTSA